MDLEFIRQKHCRVVFNSFNRFAMIQKSQTKLKQIKNNIFLSQYEINSSIEKYINRALIGIRGSFYR